MADANPPAGEAVAPQTEVTNTNLNKPEAQAQTQAPVEAPKSVDLHGFTEDQLGDLAKFMKGQGGFEAFKKRMSNPQNFTQPQESAKTEPTPETPTQPESQPQPQPKPQSLPKGYITKDEIVVKRYFEDLSRDPKYANISEQIANGDILKEMAAMGMHPIDENLNVNQAQLDQFLALKAASVPAKQTSVEPTNIPTVEYVPVENDTITSTNQALQILQQSMMLERQGQRPHPAAEKAREFIKKNGL